MTLRTRSRCTAAAGIDRAGPALRLFLAHGLRSECATRAGFACRCVQGAYGRCKNGATRQPGSDVNTRRAGLVVQSHLVVQSRLVVRTLADGGDYEDFTALVGSLCRLLLQQARVPKRKTIPGARFTAVGRSAAAQIAVSQDFKNAWKPRAASAAFASQIRNTSRHPGRIHRGCEGAIHTEWLVGWLARQLPDDD